MFGKKIMMAIDCQITSGSDRFFFGYYTCPTCIHIELDDVLRLDFLVVPTNDESTNTTYLLSQYLNFMIIPKS